MDQHLFLGFQDITLILSLAVLAVSMFLFTLIRRSPVYVVDYACAKSGDDQKASLEVLLYFLEQSALADHDRAFHLKMFFRAGIGEEAYIPRAVLEKGRLVSLEDLRDQVNVLAVGAASQLLRRTGVKAEEVDIVVVNCSSFNPTPSITALLVNHFKMRSDVKTFQLAGMGCCAGLISVDLAKDMLRVHGNKYALVVSTEVLLWFYGGKDRSMMLSSCLFRCCGSAVLLSNCKREKGRAKLKLMHCVRMNTAASDESYECVAIKEDEEGVPGAQLGEKLLEVVSNALRINIQRLAPKVLPASELWKAVWHELKRKLWNKTTGQYYVPNFKKAFNHFCIHPGGKSVIDRVSKSLGLNEYDKEPSMMALHRFGYTSSAAMWYILSYFEAKGRLKKGEVVWQIALGAGFKCTSAVWRVMRDLEFDPLPQDTAWADCIHRFPVPNKLSDHPHIRSLFKLSSYAKFQQS